MEFLRRRIGLILQALVTTVIVSLLVRIIDWRQVWIHMSTMNPLWILAAVICFPPVLFTVTWRWRMLLAVHGVHLRFWRIFELTMISQFFSAIGIGTTGGDVVKIFYAARAVPQRRTAVAFTILVDRVIGMVALLLFGVLFSLPHLPLFLSQHYTKIATLTFYLIALAGCGASFLACLGPFLFKVETLRGLIQKLPFGDRIGALFTVYEISARALSTNLIALVGSFPSHLSGAVTGYCIIRAMGFHPDIITVFGIIAIVNMLIALPVSISGLGFRDVLFIFFFALIGIDKNHAQAFSIVCLALNLFWSLAGGPFYFLYRHETHTPPPDVSEVEPLFSKP